MNDELLTKILEALESIDKRLAALEARPLFNPPPYESLPWNPLPPLTFTDNTQFYNGIPLPIGPVTMSIDND